MTSQKNDQADEPKINLQELKHTDRPATPLEAVRILAGFVCVCGQPKRARMSFCRGCYYSFPHRHSLYQRIGEGYVEAYNGALRYLRKYFYSRQPEAPSSVQENQSAG